MTSTDTMLDTAAVAADGSEASNTSKASRKRLRGSSEAHKKQCGTVLPTTIARKKIGKIVTACPPASEGARNTAATGQPSEPRQTKASVVEALLSREGGASIGSMSEATGWQAHTCRAFLTGLRKKGEEVIRASDKDSKSIYLIAPERPLESPTSAVQTEAGSN